MCRFVSFHCWWLTLWGIFALIATGSQTGFNPIRLGMPAGAVLTPRIAIEAHSLSAGKWSPARQAVSLFCILFGTEKNLLSSMLLHGGFGKKTERFLPACRLCRDGETPGDNSNSSDTLLRFSSALTHKEKLEGENKERCSSLQSAAFLFPPLRQMPSL